MALFGLFKSRQQRDAELRTGVRRAKLRIGKFVSRKEEQAQHYRQLAREAWELDDDKQFRSMAAGYLNCLDTVSRWKRYLVTLKGFELQRFEGEATREFLGSMNALTSAILTGVRPEDVACVKSDMEAAMARSEELEDALSLAMEDTAALAESPDSMNDELLCSAVGITPGGSTVVPKVKREDEFSEALSSLRKAASSGTSY